MPDVPQPPLLLIIFEVCAWLGGLVLFVQLLRGRLNTSSGQVSAWTVSVEKFVTSVLFVAAGGFIFPQLTTHLSHEILGPAATDGNWWMIVQGAAFQLGMLAGALLAAFFFRNPSPATPANGFTAKPAPILAGTITFLISLPVIGGIGFAWKAIIEFFGYSASEQDMVDLLRNADDPALLAWMIVLAAIVAPVTEELIFRAGLFRYLRTRIPRGIALILPALLFALLHGNLAAFAPLCALGVFFALAYERTGNIAVPMIAHALFNLHTIVLVMAGVTG
jgi:uncharacterized protein